METYFLEGIHCANCLSKIEEKLKTMDYVNYISLDFSTMVMKIDTSNINEVKNVIHKIEPGLKIYKERKTSNSDEVQSKDTPNHDHSEFKPAKVISRFIIGVLFFIFAILFDKEIIPEPINFSGMAFYIISYIIVGQNVLKTSFKNILRGNIFDENFLMTIATLGAFAISAEAEAVGVMLFYMVGEFFQDLAVSKSRQSIKSLIKLKPEIAHLKIDGKTKDTKPENVKINDVIIVKPGEKIPLDGEIISGKSRVDTSALTGESVPRSVTQGDQVFAGTINKSGLIKIEVTKEFKDSSVQKIMNMVENATHRKAKTEKFITKFAKYYTPAVVIVALFIAILPPILFSGQSFSNWIYRSLIILVISCPCALVISIPLGYFGGIGKASKKGILFKGSNFIDALANLKSVVFDKTGTLTEGKFKVNKIVTENGYSKSDLLKHAAYAEAHSNHPIAQSIIEKYNNQIVENKIKNYKEIEGYGVKAEIFNKKIMVGNDKLLHKENITHPVCNINSTVAHVVIDNIYAGYIVISDKLKNDSYNLSSKIRKLGVDHTMMLTGDNNHIAGYIAKKVGLDEYYAELLPEEKVEKIEQISEKENHKVAFIGDGVNDAPVITRADVGIAMGKFGSDLAIDTADVVFMTDHPSKILESIKIAKKTKKIVIENIFITLGIKFIFLMLGLIGIATMWEAVFADVGVALIAVLNSIRIIKQKI